MNGISPTRASETQPTGANLYQLVTGDDSEDDRVHWDRVYNTGGYIYGKDPSPFLKQHLHWAHPGHALDIAMGEGRNTVYMATRGFAVDGVDISEVAIRKAKRLAHENRVSINPIIADLNTYKIKPDYYQLIVNIEYLQRNLIPQIKRGLKRKGVIIFENHTIDQLSNANGQPIRRDFLLKKGELVEMFKDFEILFYQETNNGKDALASLVARRP